MSDKITCSIGLTDPTSKLGLEIWIDDKKLVDWPQLNAGFDFKYEMPDEEGEHELKFVMKGKTAEHTTVNEAGEIVKDASLTIGNLAFEDIELNQILIDKAVYTHDFNGSQPEIKDEFYGIMGCNGVLSLKFTTPIYLWLLEVM